MQLAPGILGPGAIVNSVSVTLRPFLNGFRIYANHRPCSSLPFGGYVTSSEEANRVLSKHKPLVMANRV